MDKLYLDINRFSRIQIHEFRTYKYVFLNYSRKIVFIVSSASKDCMWGSNLSFCSVGGKQVVLEYF